MFAFPALLRYKNLEFLGAAGVFMVFLSFVVVGFVFPRKKCLKIFPQDETLVVAFSQDSVEKVMDATWGFGGRAISALAQVAMLQAQKAAAAATAAGNAIVAASQERAKQLQTEAAGKGSTS